MKHILLQKSVKYKKRKNSEEPQGYHFDSLLGAWISKVDRTFLVKSTRFLALATKKEDIETGEDQKGY